VFTTRRGVEGITGGKITLGADASVAAGPIGRQASADTDVTFKAEVYSYSRSRGAFAGLALDGTVLRIDDDANDAYYGQKNVSASDVIAGKTHPSDDSARRFLTSINTSTGSQTASATTTAAAPVSQPAAGAVQSDAPAPLHSSPPTGATTFPMEDPNPGKEPR